MRQYTADEAAQIRQYRNVPDLVRQNYERMKYHDHSKKKIDPRVWWLI